MLRTPPQPPSSSSVALSVNLMRHHRYVPTAYPALLGMHSCNPPPPPHALRSPQGVQGWSGCRRPHENHSKTMCSSAAKMLNNAGESTYSCHRPWDLDQLGKLTIVHLCSRPHAVVELTDDDDHRGTPNEANTSYRRTRLTKSYAFFRSMKHVCNLILFARLRSYSRRTVNIMTIIGGKSALFSRSIPAASVVVETNRGDF